MKNKVSIIVPVYNTARFLPECVDSILRLEYTNFEVLLIDDGSTDTSPAICDDYATKDERIHVIHKANGGVSSARNVGLDMAVGDWIAFIDSDDWVKPDYLNIFNTIPSEQSIDVIHFGLMIENVSKNMILAVPQTIGIFDAWNVFQRGEYRAEVYTYLFLRKQMTTNNIRFSTDIHYSEDQEFIIKYLLVSSKVLQTHQTSYFYRVNPTSAIHKKRSYDSCLDDLRICQNVFQFCKSQRINLTTQAAQFIYTQLIESFFWALTLHTPEGYEKHMSTDLLQTLNILQDVQFAKDKKMLFYFAMRFPIITITYRRLRYIVAHFYRTILLHYVK